MQPAFHLPPGFERVLRRQRFAGLDLEVPVLSPGDLEPLARELRAARVEGSLEERVRALEAAARRLLDPRAPEHAAAQEWLPRLTGFSPAMIRRTLPEILAPLAAEPMIGLVGEAKGEIAGVVAVVAAGNVPGVALPKIVLALAAGAACMVKTASGEPLLAALFARALAEASPALARRLAVLWWPGDENGWAAALGAAVDSLVAYGSDAAITALAAGAPASFAGYGHRLSAALVRLADDESVATLAEALALDLSLYDQQGCLSPQAVYLLGSAARRSRFADRLAAALDSLATELPPAALTEGEALAIRRFRDEAEWRALGGAPVRLRTSREGLGWTVVEDESDGSWSNPLHRTAILHPLDRIASLGERLRPLLPRVESLGIGPWPDEEAVGEAARLGIPRVAPLGAMQRPDLGWWQGGRHPLAGIVRGL